jgi:flagellin
MSAIYLSAAVRQNLSSLQSTADMMAKTQNILATGLKVNSALDNPSSFFTASALNNRASDLDGLLDDMGQSIQTLKAADQGLQSITKLVEAAKGKANQALQSSSSADRARYASEYNDLLDQIEGLAKDAGYKGKNLLAGTGNDVSVVFNESGTSELNVEAVDYTDVASSLGLSRAASTSSNTPGSFTVSDQDLFDAFDPDTPDTFTIRDGSGNVLITGGDASLVGASSYAEKVSNMINAAGVTGLSASFTVGSPGSLTVTYTEGNVSIDDDNDTNNLTTVTSSNFVAGSTSGFETDAQINATLGNLNDAMSALRSQASTFGTNLTVVENRQNFTKNLINALEEGAGKLTLADTNEQGANLLALQTRQQLSSTSLSFASQADQNVLRLF